MEIAFCVYDGLTALDFVGAFDPITRLRTMGYREDISWDICAHGEAATATGELTFGVDRIDPDLGEYEMVFIPGGVETRTLIEDSSFIDWVRTAADCDWKVSVCTGALLYGAAGLLDGKTATTHPSAFDTLREYCEVADERVVEDGDTITARGVSSSIDLGLYIVEQLADTEVRTEIQAQMDYPYGGEVFSDS
ncbi:MAG: DJ-1/PfpI family protein [Halobacteriales archaeon]